MPRCSPAPRPQARRRAWKRKRSEDTRRPAHLRIVSRLDSLCDATEQLAGVARARARRELTVPVTLLNAKRARKFLRARTSFEKFSGGRDQAVTLARSRLMRCCVSLK